jgi:hypothetical protein
MCGTAAGFQRMNDNREQYLEKHRRYNRSEKGRARYRRYNAKRGRSYGRDWVQAKRERQRRQEVMQHAQ